MRIGIFTDTYFPQINGVATSTRILASELRKKGHKVYIFTTSDPNAKKPEFDVFRLPSVAFIFLKTHRASVMYSPKAVSMIKKMDLDIVHTQTEFSLGVFGKIVALRLRLPHVHTFHTMYPDYVHYIANGHLVTPKMAKSFCRFCCNVSKIVIAPTEKVKDFLVSVGVKKRIVIVPTGMDLSAFGRENFSDALLSETKCSLGISESDKVLVAIGRIAKEKSVDVLIDAMPQVVSAIPEAKLLIVGDGPVRKQLEARSKELNIEGNVIFAGARPWSEIGLYYALGDIFLNASVSEAQGLTFIEAMAAKTPVIAKNDPCLRGIITDNETGLLFERNEELPRVIIEALNNPELTERIAAAASENIRKYSAEGFAESVLDVYKDVLSDAETGGREKTPLRAIGNIANLGKKFKI